MDDGKKYKEALERARQIHNETKFDYEKGMMEEIFPELAESEDEKKDERIRKDIIWCLKRTGIKESKPINPHVTTIIKDAIAWLEKQGESDETKAKRFLINKGYPIDANGTFPTYEEIYNIIRDGLEKQGEKFADKVEPKFHEGQWIVHNVAKFVFQIVGVGTYGYNVVNREGYAKTILLSNEEDYHLWTIEDAKDGDVLICPKYAGDIIPNIFIFKDIKIKDNDVYCYCSFLKIFTTGGYVANADPVNTDFYPATKEQRDLLFKKMHEAGYMWDANKKELKKIKKDDYEPDALIEESYQQQADDLINMVTEKPAWSEDDKVGFDDAIWAIKQAKTIAKDENDMGNLWYAERWLKSLKKRCTWKPTDNQVKAFEHFLRNIMENSYLSLYKHKTNVLCSLLNDLKKLKE